MSTPGPRSTWPDRGKAALSLVCGELTGRAPLVLPTAALILGIVIGERFGGSALGGCGVFAGALLAACARRRCARTVAACAVVACAGGGYALHRFEVAGLSQGIATYLESPITLARLRGTVVKVTASPPPVRFAFDAYLPPGRRGSMILQVREVERLDGWAKTFGRVRVTCDEPLLDLRPGEAVEAFGRLYRLQAADNPGGFDAAAHYRREGVAAGLSCGYTGNIRVLPGDSSGAMGYPLERLRAWFRSLLVEDWPDLTEGASGLLETMVLGHRSMLDRRIDRLFMEMGVSHLLAVSGAQVAAIAAGAWCAARLLGLRRGATALVAFLSTGLYAVAAEPSAPVLRAVLVVGCVSLGFGLSRPVRPINLLALACLILLLVHPTQAFSAAFQLSFTATLGIVVLTPALIEAGRRSRSRLEDWRHGAIAAELRRRLADLERHRPRPEKRERNAWKRFSTELRRLAPRALGGVVRVIGLSFIVSLAAWTATAPLVAWHFHQIQWAGPFNTLVLSAPVTLMIDIGFASMLLSAVSPEAALPLRAVLSLLQEVVLQLAERLPRGYPWIVSVGRPGGLWMALGYAFLVGFAWSFRRPVRQVSDPDRFPPLVPEERRRRPSARGWLLAGAGACLVWLAWIPLSGKSGAALELTALSVGRGLAVVIRLPDGSTLLYDAGSDARTDVGAGVIAPYLRSRGVQRVDAVYVSHANLDHFSGIPGLVDQLPTGAVRVTRYFLHNAARGSPARHLIDLLCQADHPLEMVDPAPLRREYGGVLFETLWPPPGLPSSTEVNETSLVLRLTYAGRSVLLTGDIEDVAQRALIDRGDPRADVLLLPHHGSPRPSTDAFVKKVNPSVLIQSARAGAGAVLRRFADLDGVQSFNTGDTGAVTVRIGDGGMTVLPWRKPAP